MELSNDLKEQIRKEAEAMFGSDGYISSAQKEGYESGAEAYAIYKQKAERYRAALELITYKTWNALEKEEIATKALDQ